MSKNLFDQADFFEQYMELRHKASSYNNLVEQPNMKALLPDLMGMTILDMGCGFGGACTDFINRGASRVVAIDVSEKMLATARETNGHANIEYMRLGMEQIDDIWEKFDLVYSSMAMHYIADFGRVAANVYDLLGDCGIFQFSQEHPMVTAPHDGSEWIRDEKGKKVAAPVSDYLENGKRHAEWLGEDVVKYHRSISEIINTLISSGFTIANIVEPKPTAEALKTAHHLRDEIHRPTALIVKALKGY
ncbi:MAG: class I SAM-dependent methyltransferase [Defluviitaleaceae bacterium]|nr:class I SAM-dependent methyltransferase [Defluviitaleaceae bacterium]